MNRFLRCLVVVLGTTPVAGIAADDLPPLEAYGRLPQFDLYELSPSGKRAAARIYIDGRDSVAVFGLAGVTAGSSVELLMSARADKVNPRWLQFVDDDYLVLVTGASRRSIAVRGMFDYSTAHAFDLQRNEINTLLKGAHDLYPYQSGMGQIIGRSRDEPVVYMPAYSGQSYPDYSIFKVRLDRGRGRVVTKGNEHAIDYFLDADGEPLVREDFNDQADVHSIFTLQNSGFDKTEIYRRETTRPTFSTVGLTRTRDALVLLRRNSETGNRAFYTMSLADGEISGPVFEDRDRDIARVLSDVNRVVHGVEYAGFRPTYEFFDADLQARVDVIQQRLKDVSARLVSWSDNFERLLFEVQGGWTSGAFVMFEDAYGAPVTLGKSRPEIGRSHVAPVEILTYSAGDGRPIPALLTARKDRREAGRMPLIVLPHGGPAAHDVYGFDWLAQYFASRGYAVLQPQFRGSTGFGNEHLRAGRGEWGGKMQSDLDDGLRYLVESGIVDPDRVCIVGASYGGYAALAAGAFSPDAYQCVVAIAAVSDLQLMLRQESSEHGRDHWVIDYWQEQYGADASEKDELRAISPAHNAEAYLAPVLLIHGKNDTVVSIKQSTAMRRALRKADKDVELIELKGEDHWLTQEATRIETLRAAARFVDEHIGGPDTRQ